MLPCPAVTVRALSYMNSWCGKRRPESRRRVLLSSVAQCDHFTLLQTLGSTASLAGQGRTQEGGGTELAQYFDSEISPARTGQLTDEALSVHQPVWPDLSLGSQSVLGQSGPREADLESLGDEKASLRWRPLLSLGSIWRKRNEKSLPKPPLSSRCRLQHKIRRWFANFYPIKPQRRLNWTRINLHHWPASAKTKSSRTRNKIVKWLKKEFKMNFIDVLLPILTQSSFRFHAGEL